MKQMVHYALVLLILGGTAGVGLYGVNNLTSERIAEAMKRNLTEGQKQLFPAAASFDGPLSFPLSSDSGTYYKVLGADNTVIGYELDGAVQGYQSKVRVLTGLTTNGVITGIKVLEQAETPGLGAEVQAVPSTRTLWSALAGLFSEAEKESAAALLPPFQAQFAGKDLGGLAVVKQKNPGKIEAISGATITSEAVTRAVREPLEAFLAWNGK